jgi:F-type H+-transporting ATPase subunit delta
VNKLLSTTGYVKFEMNYVVDASLIGGIVIRIGDRVVDGSIKNKLEDMRKNLSSIQLA